ncbi:MAG: class I SAM-dependent methyltransferase [Pseudomonadota bacterium]
MSGTTTGTHAALMDGVYRRQRHIYDATRKFFLLGRDRLIQDLAPPTGGRVLEMGCGTGRNLVLAAQRYPEARFFGLDISAEMLTTARRKIAGERLAGRIALDQADATAVDPRALFGVDGFDRVFFSYTLSMVPDWRAALARALKATAPGGTLHVVDFGQQREMPRAIHAVLSRWLALFHVEPRYDLGEGIASVAGRQGDCMVQFTSRHRDYCWAYRIDRAPTPAQSRSRSPAQAVRDVGGPP